MVVSSRQQQILDLLKKVGTVNVAELAEKLNVSPNTVRSDLDTLASRGMIERTHGGATLPKPVLPPQLWPQGALLSPGADHIIDYALTWIKDGDSLILDGSPLCVLLAERMADFRNLRVVTTSLPVAYLLTQEPSNRVVVAGGEFNRDQLSTRGSLAQAAIRDFRADKAFFSCTGVSVQGGLTEMSTESAEVRRAMKAAADSTIVLIGSDRVGRADLFSIGPLDVARRIATDSGLDPAYVQMLAEAGARLAVCWQGGHQTYRRKFSLGSKTRIGFANLSQGVTFASMVLDSVRKAASGVDNLELLVADNQTNAETAIRNAREFLRQEIDLLIEYEGTGQATRSIRQMMREAEVPIIAVDIPIMGATHLGSDHDAAGETAGHALGSWIREHWGGQADQVLWLSSEGGATVSETDPLHFSSFQSSGPWSESLSPAARFSSALETLRPYLSNQPQVRQLVLPGGWATSEEAIRLHFTQFTQLLPSISPDQRVAVLCLVCETALGFSQAVRSAGRYENFAVVPFGDTGPTVRLELANPSTCLLGVVNLHPERYGEKIINTAIKLLKGEAVPPAVYVEHEFIAREEVQKSEEKLLVKTVVSSY
jgi:DeoR/GlpR family transcriptional regulator of sugar metabolism/ABC-type sugar transport system substrate-binding protein